MNIFECINFADSCLLELKLKSPPDADAVAWATELRDSLRQLQARLQALELDILEVKKDKIGDGAFKSDLSACYAQLSETMRLITKRQTKQSFLQRWLNSIGIHIPWLFQRELSPLERSITAITAQLHDFKDNWAMQIARQGQLYIKYADQTSFLMCQGFVPALGDSRGECYGLSMDYAIHRSTNAVAPPPFKFKQAASEMQRKQAIKNPEGSLLFPKRLGKRNYQPDLAKQVKGIIDQALKHQGTHLQLFLSATFGAHATYLQYTDENKWHYFDPNYGAFEFDDADGFSQFYYDLYTSEDYEVNSWHSYQVTELVATAPENTWEGKLNSFLYGARYEAGQTSQGRLTALLIAVSASLVGAAFFFFAPISFPFLGALGIAVVAVFVAFVAGDVSRERVIANGFHGLMAVPNYLHYSMQNTLHRLYQRIKPEPVASATDDINRMTSSIVQSMPETKPAHSDSTIQITRSMPRNNHRQLDATIPETPSAAAVTHVVQQHNQTRPVVPVDATAEEAPNNKKGGPFLRDCARYK